MKSWKNLKDSLVIEARLGAAYGTNLSSVYNTWYHILIQCHPGAVVRVFRLPRVRLRLGAQSKEVVRDGKISCVLLSDTLSIFKRI